LKTRLKLDRLAKMHGEKMWKQQLDFPFEKESETMDRLPKLQSQKIVETTVRFSN